MSVTVIKMKARAFDEEIAELDDLLKAERAARRSYLDRSIAREVDLLHQRREYAMASDRRRASPERGVVGKANRRQLAQMQTTDVGRQLTNDEKSTPVLIVDFLKAAGAKGATSRQISEFMVGEKRTAVAIDRAKQRLRREGVLVFGDGVWSLARGARKGAGKRE